MSSRTRWSAKGGGTIVTSTIASPRAFFPGTGAPLSLSRNFCPDLRAGRDADDRRAADGRDADLGPQGRFGHGDRELQGDVRPLAPEKAVSRDLDLDVKVPGRPAVPPGVALAGDADAGPGIDAGRDPDRDLLGFLDDPGAAAGPAGLARDRARSATGRAGRREFHEAALGDAAARAAAGGAGLRPAGRGRPPASAGRARDEPRQADAGLDAVDGILEAQVHRIVEILAAFGRDGPRAAARRRRTGSRRSP